VGPVRRMVRAPRFACLTGDVTRAGRG
jgi:hypothetical protein